MFYTLVNTGEEANITVIIPGLPKPLVAHSSHPNWDKIRATVDAPLYDVEAFIDLFDLSAAAARHFDALSDNGRITVANGQVFLDGDVVDNSLTKQIRRFLDEGVSNWQPLVAFMEKVESNPQEHSREQLYRWLDRHEFTITPDGDFIGYKGVQSDGNGGWQSISSGPGIVNGVEVNGHLPNNIGDTVEIARSAVHHDPAVGCSTGLHVGTYDYAKGFSRGAVLEVHVNPRDVVSVPTDCNDQKVRCCRYVVVDTLDAPYNTAVTEDNDWEDESYCDECGDYLDYCDCDDEGEEIEIPLPEPETEVKTFAGGYKTGDRVWIRDDLGNGFAAAGKFGTVSDTTSTYYVPVDADDIDHRGLYAVSEIEKRNVYHGRTVGEVWQWGDHSKFEVVDRPTDPNEYGYSEATVPLRRLDTGKPDSIAPEALNGIWWTRVL